MSCDIELPEGWASWTKVNFLTSTSFLPMQHTNPKSFVEVKYLFMLPLILSESNIHPKKNQSAISLPRVTKSVLWKSIVHVYFCLDLLSTNLTDRASINPWNY